MKRRSLLTQNFGQYSYHFYHCDVHVQLLGELHVAPLRQEGVQFAKAHVEPYQPLLHIQVLGPVQLPFTHDGLHMTINEK